MGVSRVMISTESSPLIPKEKGISSRELSLDWAPHSSALLSLSMTDVQKKTQSFVNLYLLTFASCF